MLADLGDTHDHLRCVEEGQNQVQNWHSVLRVRSPPEDWMCECAYNESTNLFINLMAQSGWFFTIPNIYQTKSTSMRFSL